eukprot:TRINITY_DN3632_c0_g1_i2.p2 TRINITY_DN3632_c0_g1~~TRINITY_DN3632_c0_g1_i2.p2  ORF type:complete len:110 (-),score=10.96 TRINITY_DN3632_c0_g1_i2:479-808(-)
MDWILERNYIQHAAPLSKDQSTKAGLITIMFGVLPQLSLVAEDFKGMGTESYTSRYLSYSWSYSCTCPSSVTSATPRFIDTGTGNIEILNNRLQLVYDGSEMLLPSLDG